MRLFIHSPHAAPRLYGQDTQHEDHCFSREGMVPRRQDGAKKDPMCANASFSYPLKLAKWG